MIPYGRQDISEEDIKSVINVLNSDFLTQGPAVPFFEDHLKKYCNAEYAVAVNSATSALHIACLAIGLNENDILWTSPISFVASANAALYCGAQVDFVDIDFDTNNMSIEYLKVKLENSKKNGTLPKVVMPVHMGGHSCDMKEIYKLSKEYNFKIIEDASHAIGGTYNDNPIGSCEYSDIAIFSFHPVKIITTAEGGVALTNNEKLFQKMNILRTHGITRDKSFMVNTDEGPWYYEQIDLGLNYRMTEIQAALGTSQISRLNNFVESRNKLASIYDENLSNLPVSIPVKNSNIYSSFHLYIIKLNNKNADDRRKIFDLMRASNIGVNVHYIPIHLHPYYQKLGFNKGDFPVSEAYYDSAISLPLYPALTKEDQSYIVNVLKKSISNIGI